nr:transposase [Rhodococcus opacus]
MSLMAMKSYSAEFKADAVAQYLADPSHTFDGIGNDLGVNRETLDALIAQSETS